MWLVFYGRVSLGFVCAPCKDSRSRRRAVYDILNHTLKTNKRDFELINKAS